MRIFRDFLGKSVVYEKETTGQVKDFIFSFNDFICVAVVVAGTESDPKMATYLFTHLAKVFGNTAKFNSYTDEEWKNIQAKWNPPLIASSFLGMDVFGRNDLKLGQIVDFELGKDGKISGFVISQQEFDKPLRKGDAPRNGFSDFIQSYEQSAGGWRTDLDLEAVKRIQKFNAFVVPASQFMEFKRGPFSGLASALLFMSPILFFLKKPKGPRIVVNR